MEALAVAPLAALSTRNRVLSLRLSLSLLQVRTLPSSCRVMTSNRARHDELIQLPTIIKVRLLRVGTRRQSGTVPGTVPDLAGDGDARDPVPRPRFVRNRGLSPVPVPDLAGTGTPPRPRFPSGGPRPVP
jgi:hypothetical protein